MARCGTTAATAAVTESCRGSALWRYGRYGSGNGELSWPLGLALSRCGRELFVEDAHNDRVVVLVVADGSARRSWAAAADAIARR